MDFGSSLEVNVRVQGYAFWNDTRCIIKRCTCITWRTWWNIFLASCDLISRDREVSWAWSIVRLGIAIRSYAIVMPAIVPNERLLSRTDPLAMYRASWSTLIKRQLLSHVYDFLVRRGKRRSILQADGRFIIRVRYQDRIL